MNNAIVFFDEQTKQLRIWQGVFIALLIVLSITSLGFGPAGWDWKLAFAWMVPDSFSQFNELQFNVVTQIRLPRFCLALLVGMTLAQTGAATQALCRNPLADPSIIGVSSGAAVMAVAVISLGPKFGLNTEVILPYAAFAGALTVTYLVYRLSKSGRDIQITTLLLAGVAINALSFALIGLMSFYADDSSLRLINYWTMGSLGGANWNSLLQSLPLLIIAITGLHLHKKQLNILLLGESEARYLGVNTTLLKRKIVVFTAIGVGAAVALTGMIGFVGLVVPHIARLLVGPNINRMMPLCMLIGCLVLLFSDWLARILVIPAELPIGIITAILGAPLFVYLLIQQREKHD
ncbi:MAG: FecCD family ABC transporter permease [Parashewanella sp.]